MHLLWNLNGITGSGNDSKNNSNASPTENILPAAMKLRKVKI